LDSLTGQVNRLESNDLITLNASLCRRFIHLAKQQDSKS
jgi:hypothetical protein